MRETMKNNNDLFYTCSLIEDVCDDDYDHVVDRLVEVYTSWIDAVLCNYNTDVYYQSRNIFTSAARKGKSAPENTHSKRKNLCLN